MKAGIERPLYANRDETGQKVTTYKGVGRPYAIDGKGEIKIGSPLNKSGFFPLGPNRPVSGLKFNV